ncbi:NAD(P)-binding domain-containing protein [Streptomyces jietaisiensis]|uniref:NADPH-dependent F420 reductase n=1 Tax=Streptomyces griseoaurantiacus TaxID=68213 RepID=UPI002E2B66DE|nr:NAD(P)-binding domain-containing protein [Streptomyces jietaisiensis]
MDATSVFCDTKRRQPPFGGAEAVRLRHHPSSAPRRRKRRERVMPRTLGLIGSGLIGTSLARLVVAAGMEVVLSNSRGPESLAELVGTLGSGARAAVPEEAAEAGDLVVVTIPLRAYGRLPVAALRGRTVLDTMNYYPQRDGRVAELDAGRLTTSELVQRHLAGASVVKVFNNIGSHQLLSLARPAGAADRSALPLAGDEEPARREAARLLDVLGYDAVDMGPLAESWRSEPGTPVYTRPYLGETPPGLTAEEYFPWFLRNPGRPVPASLVRELTETAVRGPAGGVLPAGAAR